MFKVLKIAMIGGILVAGANAEDFLAKVTAGALSDISSSVKKISSKEVGVYAEFQKGKDSEYIKMQIAQGLGSYNLPGYYLAYTVKREIKYSRYGRYPLFTYSAAAYDKNTDEFHKISSSFVLNNNTVVRQLRDNFKTTMESRLGGWQ